jgi:hypothetical protein
MREIPLTKGMVALVDDCDFENLSKYNWSVTWQGARYYAHRFAVINGKRTDAKMHRELLGLGRNHLEVHHKNGNGLDNRRGNLEILTPQDHRSFHGDRASNTSGHRGISKNKNTNRWRVRVQRDGVIHYLGNFTMIQDAKIARDEWLGKKEGGKG